MKKGTFFSGCADIFACVCVVLVLLTGFVSCKKKSSDPVDIQRFSVTPSAYNLDVKGGSFTITVVANGDWFVDMDRLASWVEVFPDHGTNTLYGVEVTAKGKSKPDSTTVFFMNNAGETAMLKIGCGIDVVPEVDINGTGILAGLFSVGKGSRVRFSQGNLQFNAMAGTHKTADGKEVKGVWRFAPNQYDVIGEANADVDSLYNGWIDLFGWGTSGWDNTVSDRYAANFAAWSTSDTVMFESQNTYGYGPSINSSDANLTGGSRYADWGVYNAISNGSNEPGMWRTLTASEWRYLMLSRSNAKGLRGQATVMSVHGYILFPDGSNVTQFGFVPDANDWTTNIISTKDEWQIMENAGAVFLPCAGRRYGKEVDNVTAWGVYWSSTMNDEGSAHGIGFFEKFGVTYVPYLRYRAFSVRLVQNY